MLVYTHGYMSSLGLGPLLGRYDSVKIIYIRKKKLSWKLKSGSIEIMRQ